MRYGMGDAATNLTAQALGTAASIPSPASPFLAIAAGLTALLGNIFSGCGQTCIASSNEANEVGNQMTNNLNLYLAQPQPHYQSAQTAALANFDQMWAALVQFCSNPQLGSAGQKCISDRQQGACTWKSSPGGWQQQNGQWTYVSPGPAGSGSTCWNYFVGMRDPIANDPTVVPDPTPVSAVSGVASSVSSVISSVLPASVSGFLTQDLFGFPVWAVGGAALVAIWLLSEEL